MRRALVAGAALCLVTGCGTQPDESGGVTSPGGVDERSAPQAVVDAPDPAEVSIPALGVSSSLVPLGVDADGQHEVPPLSEPEQAGWFRPGPEPGEAGAAIILGHVNGGGRPGVFAELDRLAAGDTVVVDDLTFRVYEVARVPKDEFPADRVYGETEVPELRAITCGGAFDEASGDYVDNVIVYARLVSP